MNTLNVSGVANLPEILYCGMDICGVLVNDLKHCEKTEFEKHAAAATLPKLSGEEKWGFGSSETSRGAWNLTPTLVGRSWSSKTVRETLRSIQKQPKMP